MDRFKEKKFFDANRQTKIRPFFYCFISSDFSSSSNVSIKQGHFLLHFIQRITLTFEHIQEDEPF